MFSVRLSGQNFYMKLIFCVLISGHVFRQSQYYFKHLREQLAYDQTCSDTLLDCNVERQVQV